MKLHTDMITENFCDDCDDCVHAVFDAKKFYDFKVGRIRCHCGCVIKPCNECLDEYGNHYNCTECPWEKAKIVDAMTDEEYVRWTKENEPSIYALMTTGEMGDLFKKIALDMEMKGHEKTIKQMDEIFYAFVFIDKNCIYFRDTTFDDDFKDFKVAVDSFLRFKDWKDVEKFVKSTKKLSKKGVISRKHTNKK